MKNKDKSDTTRHFQSEVHPRNKQTNQQNTQSAFGTQHPSVQFDNNVGLIVIENTYNKFKINPTKNLEEQIFSLLRTKFFPRYKYQMSYLAQFSKIVNGEGVFKR